MTAMAISRVADAVIKAHFTNVYVAQDKICDKELASVSDNSAKIHRKQPYNGAFCSYTAYLVIVLHRGA